MAPHKQKTKQHRRRLWTVGALEVNFNVMRSVNWCNVVIYNMQLHQAVAYSSSSTAPPNSRLASLISPDTHTPVAADNGRVLHDSESVQQRQFYTPPAPPPGRCRHLSQSLPSAGGQALAICSAVWSSLWCPDISAEAVSSFLWGNFTNLVPLGEEIPLKRGHQRGAPP